MSSAVQKMVVALTLCASSVLTHAYDHKDCLAGVNSTRQSSTLDEAVKLLLSTNSALLEAGVINDYDKVFHLTSSAQIASGALNSAQIITALRSNGKFEQADLIDKILKIEFTGVFAKFKAARNGFGKLTEQLKNPTLRDQALKLSLELEKVLVQIRACEN